MMKNSFFTLVVVVAFMFTSCSNEDSGLAGDQNLKLLKTFQVNKDATGAYSVDFKVSDNTQVDKVFNEQENTRQYFLYPTNKTTENNISQNFALNNDQIKIGFVDTKTDNFPSITIIDDIKFANKSSDLVKLESYSFVSNEDGTFSLDFEVKNNIDVSYVYNEEISTYEIHLEDGKGGETNFSRNLVKEEGKLLKIDFVTHLYNLGAKSNKAAMLVRKPKVIVDSGNDV
jgi:hypothetical protein